MYNKIFLAHHNDNENFIPYDPTLISYDTRNLKLDNKYFSELSMIDDLLSMGNLLPDYVGVGHYRRLFQSDFFEKESDSIPPYVFGREYGKDSRPSLPYTKEYFKMATSNYVLDLNDKDMLVLEPFEKSSRKALYTLCDIGWLKKGLVDNFYIYLKNNLKREEYDLIYKVSMTEKSHYCNNIMYSSREVFISYWTFVMRIIKGFAEFMESNRKRKSLITPRCYGYLSEYIMKPVCEDIMGYNIGYKKSICFEI